MNDTRKVLVLARAKVERRWIQGAATDIRGGVCLAAAIQSASDQLFGTGEIRRSGRADGLVMEVITKKYGHYTGIPHWNDSDSRTKQQVLDVLDTAIRLADPANPVETPAPVVEPPKSVIQKVKELVGV